MLWFLCWTFALFHSDHGAAEPTDWMKPPSWSGNFWGPAATRDRATGKLPPIHFTKSMTRWESWGKSVLRDGDIVFRLGDARTLAGCFPMSQFIADASASRFSHTGVAAVEDGSVVVYDCSSSGIQRQPFAVWMLDCMGPMGIKRLKEQERKHIPGVLKYCRDTFVKQVPFDYGFQIDDRELYCVEMTEKAFRSQGLALSAPVVLGDWQNLVHFPLTTFLFEKLSVFALEQPFSVDQLVYVPGNETEGIWASPLLEQVYPKKIEGTATLKRPAPEPGKLSLQGDVAVAKFVVYELRRSYAELPLRVLINYLPRRSSAASIAKNVSPADEEDREATVAERGVPAPRVR